MATGGHLFFFGPLKGILLFGGLLKTIVGIRGIQTKRKEELVIHSELC